MQSVHVDLDNEREVHKRYQENFGFQAPAILSLKFHMGVGGSNTNFRREDLVSCFLI